MAAVHGPPPSWNHSSNWQFVAPTPPPVPARLHARDRLSVAFVPETDGYLSPVRGYEHFESVFLPMPDDSEHGPPLPPRQPLRRSVSLTHRPVPQPSSMDNEAHSRLPEPTLGEVVASLRMARNHRTSHLTPASSAPLLGQVVPISRWPLRDTGAQTSSPVRVIPLARWPLLDTATTGRLTMDGIVVRGPASHGNEYVEGPCSVQPDGCSQRRRVGRKSTPVRTGANPPNGATSAADRPLPVSSEILGLSDDNRLSDRERRGGFTSKLRRFLTCGSATDVDDVQANVVEYCHGADGTGTVCRRCGHCRCSECTRAEESAALCRARAVVDTVTCMCCVRSVFYHCLKDDAGEEDDCSDEPCACCERPHCAVRWAVMALLLPCLPCLCLYPPLSCAIQTMCRHRRAGRACRCSQHPRTSGLKGLLESESSST